MFQEEINKRNGVIDNLDYAAAQLHIRNENEIFIRL